MSYDFNVIARNPRTNAPIGACDHAISFERYVINSDDFRSLNYAANTSIFMRAPINGASSIRMWISGEEVKHNDPTYGWSLVLDPDRIVSEGGQVEQIATLAPAWTNSVKYFLNDIVSISGVNFVCVTPNIGQQPSVHSVFWQVFNEAIPQSSHISGVVFYKIMFNKPVRIVVPLIEVSYFTRQPFCLKCSGLGTLNDFKRANSGSFLRVTQTDKLAQKALKWILTSQCSFYPSFVCTLKSYIGRKLGIQITETDIQTSVLTALTQMQQVQQAQGTVQTLEPSEILKDIVNVTAIIDPNDPTVVRVSATVSSYGGTTAPFGFAVRMNQ